MHRLSSQFAAVRLHQREGATGSSAAPLLACRRDLARNGGRRGGSQGQREVDGSGATGGLVRRRSPEKSHAVTSACGLSRGQLTGIVPLRPRHEGGSGW
jgi:hypothetical protein